MSTRLDLSKLSLMDALDLAMLIEEEAYQRYKAFADQAGGSENGFFFASMAENEAKHGQELMARRKTLFGTTQPRVSLTDLFDVEAPDQGAPRRTMSLLDAYQLARSSEVKAHDFFAEALGHVSDPDVQALFAELRDEETEHMRMIDEAVAKLPPSAGVKNFYFEDETPAL